MIEQCFLMTTNQDGGHPVRTLFATYRRNRLTILHAYPFTFFISTILGGFFTVAFPMAIYFFMFGGQVSDTFVYYANTNDFVSFVTLGGAMNALAVSSTLSVSRAYITEIREGTLEPFLLSPASRIGYYLGCMSEQFGRSLLQFMIIVAVGIPFGLRFPLYILPQFTFVILLASFSFLALSIPLSAFMVSTRDTYISQNTVFTAMLLLCGVMFPIEYLPNALQVVANIFPMTPILQVFRAVVLSGETLAQNYIAIIHCFALSVFYVMSGAVCVKLAEKKLIENVYA